MPTLLGFQHIPSGGDNTNTLTSSAFTPSNGDVIVTAATTWDTSSTMAAPTGGGQTYTPQKVISPGGFRPWCSLYTAVIAGSPGSMQISSAHVGPASRHNFAVWRWSAAQLAATPALNSPDNNSGPSAPSSSLTTTAPGSVICAVCVDWQARNPSTRVYLSAADVTEDGLFDGSGSASSVAYFWHQSVASPGATAVGLSTPNNMNWALGAVEIQAAASAPERAPLRLNQYGGFF
ncbi:hypothetical protein [Nonomuraea sp. NPDC002799]